MTVTTNAVPAATDAPMVGTPPRVNGAAGLVMPRIDSAVVPVLVSCTVTVLDRPVGWESNDTEVGVAARPGEVPNPVRPKVKVPTRADGGLVAALLGLTS